MKGMTIIVKTISSWVKFIIVLYGIYIIVFGDFTPGGGFAGGVILAASFVLLTLAYGKDFAEKNFPLSLALILTCVGALSFALIATVPMLFDSSGFCSNFIFKESLFGENLDFRLMGSGTIAVIEFAIGLAVGASIYLVIRSLFAYRAGKEQES